MPQESLSTVPRALLGNWHTTDGQNLWTIGLYENSVVYKNKVWHKIFFPKAKGSHYELVLEDGDIKEKLFLKTKKETLLMGHSPDNLQAFSRNHTHKKEVIFEDDEPFSGNLLENKKAVLKGYIHHFNKHTKRTGKTNFRNVFTGNYNKPTFEVNETGEFEVLIDIHYPQEVYTSVAGMWCNIFLSPGDTTFVFIDPYDFYGPDHTTQKLLFMGANARLNYDLYAVKNIENLNISEINKTILEISKEDYKLRILDALDHNLEDLNSYAAKHAFGKKAMQVQTLKFRNKAYETILGFDMYQYFDYSSKARKASKEGKKLHIPRPVNTYTPAYFDFIHTTNLNKHENLLSGSPYYFALSRIRSSRFVYPGVSYQFTAYANYLTKKNITLSATEHNMLTHLIEAKSVSRINEITKKDTSTRNSLMKHFSEFEDSEHFPDAQDARMKKIQQYFKIGNGLARDLIISQGLCRSNKSEYKPFSAEDQATITTDIQEPYIVDYLLNLSAEKNKMMEARMREFEKRTDITICETPDAEPEKIFETIMDAYPGKVVFVDFWATWCGPCRSAMGRMKPFKEAMKNKDVQFVYITNETSPEEEWKLTLVDIPGQHYRLTREQWKVICNHFKVDGIPFYVLVDKNGKVVNAKVNRSATNDQLIEMVMKHVR